MVLVAAGTRGCADDAATSAASFGRRNAGLDLEFGNRVGRRIDSDLTELAFVIVSAIQGKVVIRRPSHERLECHSPRD